MNNLPISSFATEANYYKPITCPGTFDLRSGEPSLLRIPDNNSALAASAMQSFVALAHEIRNPLTNINLSVEMLAAGLKDRDLQIYLDIIARGSLRIQGLVNQLLASRQADRVYQEKHSIHRLLDEVIEMAADRIGLNKVLVIKDYGMDGELLFDEPKMKIALTNIIINAVESMTSGKKELRLVTKSLESGYVLYIEDSGCGIGEEELKLIFDPYFTRKSGGLGLGLTATYDILLSNAIGIGVESALGVGTRFLLYFNQNR